MASSSTYRHSGDEAAILQPSGVPSECWAFGRATPVVERFGRVLFVLLLVALAGYVAAIAWELNSGRTADAAVHIDFIAFWAAAKVAMAGDAVAAFDADTLIAHQSLALPGDWPPYPWYYPALFHLIVAPLGLLPFTPAFALFSACALGVYIWALRGWAKPVPGGLSLAVAAPPVAFVLATGNASLIWSAPLVAALAFLATGRTVASGIMIAVLTIKPQLGLLIPIALVAGRHWGVLLSAALAAVVLNGLTVAVFGIDYWGAFFNSMATTAAEFADYGQNAVTMVTWYAFSRQLGAGHEAALAVQAVSLLAAAGAVALIWTRRAPAFDIKAAALCLGILVSTPYAFQYELVLAVVAALFLARAGLGTYGAGRAWLAALWGLPLPGWIVPGLEIAHYTAPALTLSLAAVTCLALRRNAAVAPT